MITKILDETTKLKNEKDTKELNFHEPIKESMMTAEVYKVDLRIKNKKNV